jgi:N-acetylglucosaminyldiphosphoundecaprenol N-acetyl-beta-D-mannosaminyltransferase
MDDFDRDVYCIAGIPFDAIDLSKTMDRLRDAKHKNTTCFLTTPNLNFLAFAQNDQEFRNSIIHSDLVIVDGAPIVWMAKLLGIPIKERVAGSTLFEALGKEWRRKINVYFFGGQDGVGELACQRINEKSTALTCVGNYAPGFGSIEEMSSQDIIAGINVSKPDLLVVSIGGYRGQKWIMQNLHNITAPIISNLGAVINFEAKKLKRAPSIFQKLGFEWIWRIKEEPHLWRRYWDDGQVFLKVFITKILPHAVWLKLNRARLENAQTSAEVSMSEGESLKITINGVILDPVNLDIRNLFRQAIVQKKDIELDLTNTRYLSFGFFGLILMLKKQLDKNKLMIKLSGTTPSMRKLLHWNGLTYLVE